MTILYILLGVAVLIILWAIFAYNSLVVSRNRVDEAWSDIDVQLKRRYDLIPNLIETVKGYAAQESNVFQNVTEARSRAMGARSPHDKEVAENMLSGTLKSLFAVAESYPELKSNTNFLELQRELSDTENKIQAARRFYNTNVLVLNTKIDTIPTNLVAGSFGFWKHEFFEADDGERALPKVKF